MRMCACFVFHHALGRKDQIPRRGCREARRTEVCMSARGLIERYQSGLRMVRWFSLESAETFVVIFVSISSQHASRYPLGVVSPTYTSSFISTSIRVQ